MRFFAETLQRTEFNRDDLSQHIDIFWWLAGLGVDSSPDCAGYLTSWIGKHGDVGEAIDRSCSTISSAIEQQPRTTSTLAASA